MKFYKSWLLPATCTIILVVTTYATSTEAAKQKQAEVNLQQVAEVVAATAAPAISLKYGEKISKKVSNQEVTFNPNSPVDIDQNLDNNALKLEKKVPVPSKRGRSRIERIDLPTHRPNDQLISQLSESGGAGKNQLVVQHDIPIVHKSNVALEKPITSTKGQSQQQQQQQRNANRSRSANAPTKTQQQKHQQLQPTQNSQLNYENKRNIAKTKTTANQHNDRQRKPTTATTKNNNQRIQQQQQHHDHLLSPNNPTNVSHHQNRHNSNKNNRNIISKPDSLLAASNAAPPPPPTAAAITSDLQTKSETSSNRQRGKVIDQQSIVVGNINSTNNIHANKRKFITSTSTIIPIISSSSSSLSSTTTTITTPRPYFQLANNFNIFTSEFWQFLNPNSSPVPRIQVTSTTTSTTTRKPPKKYKPPTSATTKEEKLSLLKPKQTIPSRTTTTTTKRPIRPESTTTKKDDGPFRIALPTFNVLSSKGDTNQEGEIGKRNVGKEGNLRDRFQCPRESEVRFQLFPKICKIDEDCKVWNRDEICCEIFGAKSCVTGLPKPLEETSHAPILGVIQRKCPNRPLAELWWEVKECETDMDCWPRLCCPDGRRRYCRTSQPELDTVPVPVQRSFNYLTEYLECTAPPPPIFDLHPKTCSSTLDCFPNVCCQEAGLRHCRPPKKSVLTMLANVFNVDFVKRLTQNIVIK